MASCSACRILQDGCIQAVAISGNSASTGILLFVLQSWSYMVVPRRMYSMWPSSRFLSGSFARGFPEGGASCAERALFENGSCHSGPALKSGKAKPSWLEVPLMLAGGNRRDRTTGTGSSRAAPSGSRLLRILLVSNWKGHIAMFDYSCNRCMYWLQLLHNDVARGNL